MYTGSSKLDVCRDPPSIIIIEGKYLFLYFESLNTLSDLYSRDHDLYPKLVYSRVRPGPRITTGQSFFLYNSQTKRQTLRSFTLDYSHSIATKSAYRS